MERLLVSLESPLASLVPNQVIPSFLLLRFSLLLLAEKGSSRDPCSETFAGGSAFSETEMKTMSEFVASIKDKIFAYISFHSYSQVILLPYGYTNVHVDNYADLMEIGNASANALAKRYGTRYQVGNVVDILCKFELPVIVPIIKAGVFNPCQWPYSAMNNYPSQLFTFDKSFQTSPAAVLWTGFAGH